MIALDTNFLVYAARSDSPLNEAAFSAFSALVAADESWAIPWPCVHEYIAVVTNQRLFPDPTPLFTALEQVDEYARAGALFLAEGPGHRGRLRAAAEAMNARGPRIHDAKIAAICLAHGVRELWTVDRDFSRVDGLRVRNPLQDQTDAEGPPSAEGGPSTVN